MSLAQRKRRLDQRIRRAYGVAAALGVLLSFLHAMGTRPLSDLDFAGFDRLERALPDASVPDDITLVVIDDQTLRDIGESWPFSRDIWARFYDKVARYQPSVIATDVVFDQPSSTEELALAEHILEEIQTSGLQSSPQGQQLLRSLQVEIRNRDRDRRLADALSNAGVVLLAAIQSTSADPLRAPGPHPPGMWVLDTLDMDAPPFAGPHLTLSTPALATSARGSVLVNIYPDDDSSVRSYPYVHRGPEPGELFPSLALGAVLTAHPEFHTRAEGLASAQPLLRLFDHESIRKVRFSDVLFAAEDSPGLEEALSGRMVFVGAFAPGLGDFYPTTRSNAWTGIEIHVAAAANLMTATHLYNHSTTRWVGLLEMLVLLSLLLWICVRRRPRLRVVTAATFALVTLHLALVYLLAAYAHWLLPWMPPVLGSGAVLIVASVERFARLQQQRLELIERQRIAQIVQEREQRFRAIITHVADAIITFQPSGQIQLVNDAAQSMFLLPTGSVLSSDVRVLFPMWNEVMFDEMGEEHVETRAVRGDGSTFDAEVALSRSELDGELTYIAVAQDISERKALERMREDLTAMTTHELRTPLTSIRGSLKLLKSGVLGPIEGKSGELVSIAHENTERLLRLVNDLLDLQKMDAGRMDFERVECDLVEVIREVAEANSGFALEHGVQLAFDEPEGEIIATLDPGRMHQVITNLVSNAVKFSPEGERVELTVEDRGEHVRICVIDRGPGIPKEAQARLFERFAQVHTGQSQGRTKGTGLGLAIVRAIVRGHGGEVDFDTRVGEGTTFYVDLPRS